MYEKIFRAKRQVGKRIKELRTSQNLSMADLSSRSGNVSKGTISCIERDISDPHLTTLYAIAHGLGVPISELLE